MEKVSVKAKYLSTISIPTLVAGGLFSWWHSLPFLLSTFMCSRISISPTIFQSKDKRSAVYVILTSSSLLKLITYQIILLVHDWSKHVTWLNMILDIPRFQNSPRYKKYLKAGFEHNSSWKTALFSEQLSGDKNLNIGFVPNGGYYPYHDWMAIFYLGPLTYQLEHGVFRYQSKS